MSKSAVSGTTLRKYDKTDKISLTSDVPATRRSGSNILALTVYKSVKAHRHQIDGVDCSDQYSDRGARFASKVHDASYKRHTLPFLIL